jgi:hypothetical protein
MLRALLFAGTGVAWFTFWFVTGPDESMASMQEWPRVIWFSATLLLIALALVTFGRMVGGRSVIRLATIAAATAGVMGVVNIVEDGFRVEGAFYAFVLGLLVLDVALGALALTIARTVAGRRRLLAAIPAATLAAILFPPAGGPLMLGAWLAASAVALRDGKPLPSSELGF